MSAVLRATVATSGTKVLTLLVSVVSLAITSRVLGPEGRGYVAVVTTWVALFATLGHLSLGQVTLSRAATGAGPEWMPHAIGVLATFALAAPVLCAVVVGVAALAGAPVPLASVPAPHRALALASLPLTMWVSYASYLLMAAGRLRESNHAQVAGAVCALAALAVLVLWLGLGAAGALGAALVGQLAATAVGARALLAASSGRVRVDLGTLRGYVGAGARLHLTAIGAFLFSSLDVLMIDHFRGKVEAGHFQLAFQLYAPLLLVPQAVTEVLGSKLSSLGVRGVWPVQKRLMLGTIAAMAAAAAALAVVAPVTVRVLAGDSFAASVPVYRIYLLGVGAATVNGIMGVQWIGRGLFLQASALTLAAGLANFVCNLVFIPRWGAAGAATATVVGAYAIPFTANTIMWLRCDREAAGRPAPAAAAAAGS